jgi:hypothetical protein
MHAPKGKCEKEGDAHLSGSTLTDRRTDREREGALCEFVPVFPTPFFLQ